MVSRLAFCLAFLPLSTLALPAWAAENGVLQIVVSKDRQSLSLYRDGAEIATSRVSTGKRGHDTPTGIFSILEKRRQHKSNLYSNAPMPFMQRLTWSGIALHEGAVPTYPASHGCIRLPGKFARSLFDMTGRGVHVVVSNAPVAPSRIVHDALFSPRQDAPDMILFSSTPLRSTRSMTGEKPVEVATSDISALPLPELAPAPEKPPLRILITRTSERDRIRDMQAMLNQLGFEAGTADGIAGDGTRRAVAAFRLAKNLPPSKTVLDPAFLTALREAAGRPALTEGQLQVRQNFLPLFEAPVGIRQPEKELGTHFFIATEADPATGQAEWTAMTLENHLTGAAMKRLGITERLTPAEANAASALERIDIAPELRSRIERLIGKGASITISDNNTSPETGKGTDFITITHPEGAARKG